MILSPAPPKGGTHVELDPSFWTPGMPAPLPLAVVDQMKYSFSFQAFRQKVTTRDPAQPVTTSEKFPFAMPFIEMASSL